MTELGELDNFATRIIAMCKKRGWSLAWPERGAYLHLEVSELIEAVRGKHGDPTAEGGDVFLAFFALLSANGIKPSAAISAAISTLERLETIPRYAGEETEYLDIPAFLRRGKD